MLKLLVDRSDLVVVTIFCWEIDGEVEASHLKSDVPKEGIDVVEKVEFSFRKPNYADSNVIIRNSDFKTEGEDTRLDVSAFQNQILRSLLVDSDMKDEDGKKIPINNATISNLVPAVARAAVSGALEFIRI